MIKAPSVESLPFAGTDRVGTLCDGTGKYLDGDTGEAEGWQLTKTSIFQGFLNGNDEAAARSHLLSSDRFYMLPCDYPTFKSVPVWILGEMMKVLYHGGKILVAAPDEEAFKHLAGLLANPYKVLLAAPAEGEG